MNEKSTDRLAPPTPPFSCGCGRTFANMAQLLAHRQKREC